MGETALGVTLKQFWRDSRTGFPNQDKKMYRLEGEKKYSRQKCQASAPHCQPIFSNQFWTDSCFSALDLNQIWIFKKRSRKLNIKYAVICQKQHKINYFLLKQALKTNEKQYAWTSLTRLTPGARSTRLSAFLPFWLCFPIRRALEKQVLLPNTDLRTLKPIISSMFPFPLTENLWAQVFPIHCPTRHTFFRDC